jgi:carbamoylphosphate synthase large subunit
LSKPPLSVLIVAAKWWPLSARLALALHRHGCEVRAICPAGHPLTRLSCIRRIYPYGGIFSLSSLRRALQESRVDVVIPCDDGVVAQLHALYELDSSLRPLIASSLGSPDSYSMVESRHRFLGMALKLGIRVPRTRRVAGAQDLAAWHADTGSAAVLKVDGETGGNGVRISRSFDDSLAAWRELSAPTSYATACKRLVIDRDPLALWMRERHHVRDVTVQEFIPGRPANSMLVARRGELLSIVSVIVVAAEGPTGAATIVRVIQNEQMRKAAELVVSQLKLSGFYGLDFIIESGTGTPVLIEMNPRCTQLGHIELAEEGCLAGVFAAAMRGEPRPPAQNPIPGHKIALFPQALAAGEPCRAYLDASYHDVPSEEPQLVSELILKSWPQRRWAARLYHAFNPLRRAEPVLFETLGAEAFGTEGIGTEDAVAAFAN